MFDIPVDNPALTLVQLSASIALPRILREAAQMRLGHFVAEQPRSLQEIDSHYSLDESVLDQVLDVLVCNDNLLEEDGLYHPTNWL